MNEIESSKESKLETLGRLSAIGKAVSSKNAKRLSVNNACNPANRLAEEKTIMDAVYDDMWNEYTTLR